MSGRFEAPKGTYDYLPPLAAQRAAVAGVMLQQARLAGYQRIETPIFEDTALFARGVGESTDVVQKEMYTFTDKGGRSLTLRPELTAGVLRALIEHGRVGPTAGLVKVAFSGPQFRYEKPQAGRQRQFDQACRPLYRERLLDFLHGLGDQLPAEARARAEQNPLRVLDMKDPYIQELTASAPLLRDALCAACQEYHEAVCELLEAAGVKWVEAPRLVRGLDYYVRTTFEWQAEGMDAAQNALGGGGRYDGLSELLGGPPAPSVGWALGVDRTVLALQRSGKLPDAPESLEVLVLPLARTAQARTIAFTLVRDLRRAGIAADLPYAERPLRRHLQAAAKRDARAVVILGDEELAAGQATVRDMTAHQQTSVSLDAVAAAIRQLLTAHPPQAG